MLVNMEQTQSPEDQLRRLLSTIEFSPMRKEWGRKGRLNKNISETYSHLFLALTKLIKVIKVVLKCYQNYPKVYKRIGPQSRSGGLESFLLKVQNVKHLLEELLTNHVKLTLPSTLPGEIVKLIMDYTVAGKRKLDVGFYSRRKLDQICEGIQRRKFLTLINTITVSLFNTILFNRMELGGFTIEAQMESISRDARAFQELADEDNSQKDFSKFSKLELPASRRRKGSVLHYLSRSPHGGHGLGSRRISRKPTALTHDLAVFLL